MNHHMDSRFDSEWLDMLLPHNKGKELLKRLGASLTDYGVISARGRSLYELVPYREQQTEYFTETDISEDEEIQMGGMQL